jgi:hypothetical protein
VLVGAQARLITLVSLVTAVPCRFVDTNCEELR